MCVKHILDLNYMIFHYKFIVPKYLKFRNPPQDGAMETISQLNTDMSI